MEESPSETLFQGSSAPPDNPDPGRGASIALEGQGCDADGGECSPCFTCHGRDGAGDPVAGIPRLHGQSWLYMYGALQDFASGERPHPTMTDVAQSLSLNAMRDVAAYYAMQDLDTPYESAAADARLEPGYEQIVRGGVLASVGDASRGIQACVNCHGPNGRGLPPVYPYLAGQYRDYLEMQLKAFAKGERGGGRLGIMQDIAQRMTTSEIEDVAAYFASVRPVEHPRQSIAAEAPPDAGPVQQEARQ